MNKLRCPECKAVIETNDTEVECHCGKRLRAPTATRPTTTAQRPTAAGPAHGGSGELTGTLYRWEARRSNATLAQTADVRTTFFPIYPSVASVNLALVGNAFSSMAATTRQRKAIRREVRYILQVAPRWRAQKATALRLSGHVLSLPFNDGAVQRDLRDVQFWAVHPRSGAGIVLKFNDNEGFLRIKLAGDAIDQLRGALTLAAPSKQGTWKPEPIDHPGPRWILDASLMPSGGILDLLVKFMLAFVMLVLVVFWPAFLAWGVAVLILCRRDFDTFKPGWRTWTFLATPVVGFVVLSALSG